MFPKCVSCCFQPGRASCLGCMSQCEPHLWPHRAACSLPGSTYSPMLSFLRNNWAWAQGPGEHSPNVAKEKPKLKARRFCHFSSPWCLHLQNGNQVSSFGFLQTQTSREGFGLRYFILRGDTRKYKRRREGNVTRLGKQPGNELVIVVGNLLRTHV